MYERFVNNVVDFVINPAEIKNDREGVIAQTILTRIKRSERIFSLSNKSQRDIVYDFVVCPEHVVLYSKALAGSYHKDARFALNRAQWSYEYRYTYILGKRFTYQASPTKHKKLLLRQKFSISHLQVSIFISVVKMLSPKSL